MLDRACSTALVTSSLDNSSATSATEPTPHSSHRQRTKSRATLAAAGVAGSSSLAVSIEVLLPCVGPCSTCAVGEPGDSEQRLEYLLAAAQSRLGRDPYVRGSPAGVVQLPVGRSDRRVGRLEHARIEQRVPRRGDRGAARAPDHL